MPWNSRLTGLQPGDGVYHPKFGLGLVLSCESFEAGDERGQVRFQWHGVKWMALSVAPMCRMPEELAAECRRQSGWKATLQQPTREDELQLLLAPAPVAIAMRVPSGLRLRLSELQLRATSHANGRWWPAPECLQVLLNADGSIAARMRFATGYQPPYRPWLEFTGRKGWRSR